jgi:hypothetical protein
MSHKLIANPEFPERLNIIHLSRGNVEKKTPFLGEKAKKTVKPLKL